MDLDDPVAAAATNQRQHCSQRKMAAILYFLWGEGALCGAVAGGINGLMNGIIWGFVLLSGCFSGLLLFAQARQRGALTTVVFGSLAEIPFVIAMNYLAVIFQVPP